jgi:hypothetical protein
MTPRAAIRLRDTHDDAIPELLLKTTENHGAGQFGSVTYVQRLATKGGLPPKGRCTKSPSAATSVMLPNPGQ